MVTPNNTEGGNTRPKASTTTAGEFPLQMLPYTCHVARDVIYDVIPLSSSLLSTTRSNTFTNITVRASCWLLEMTPLLLPPLLLLLLVVVARALEEDDAPPPLLRDAYPSWTPPAPPRALGRPLLLTPLLQEGLEAEARRQAQVTDLFPGDLSSYAGFLTVNETCNANLFFWFFPAKSAVLESPVVLWLQGGPGASSLFGLFTEIGPFSVEPDGVTLRENPASWLEEHSLLFVDNPVGTGFSFTHSDCGYATNMQRVADDLHSALAQFYAMFPEIRAAPFYIAGESFAGKYIPALGNRILDGNRDSTHPINLQGVVMGNGYYDPEHMLSLSELAYSLGLVDHDVRHAMREQQNRTLAAIRDQNYTQAYFGFARTVGLLQQSSRHLSLYHLLRAEEDLFPYGSGHFARFLERGAVRGAIHVGDAEFSSVGVVYSRLLGAFMTSSRRWLERLLDAGVRALSYSGQLDVVVGYALSKDAYATLNFSHSSSYAAAPRRPWYVGRRLAGYIKSGGGFTEALVRGAGHLVPMDQPTQLLTLLRWFTLNQTLSLG